MIRTPLVGLLLLAGCGLLHAANSPASAPAPRPAPADSINLVLFGDEKLLCVRLHVNVNGQSIPEIWKKTFASLFAYYDRNGDGYLDAKEGAIVPSPFAVRQPLWGQFAPYTGPAIRWAEYDRDGDGRVSPAELTAYYHRHGLGSLQIGVGRPQSTAALSAALLKVIDADGSGSVSDVEWKTAVDSLRKFDRNDDELVGPGELVPKISYPGAIGSILLLPPSKAEKSAPELANLPLLLLPDDPADTEWAEVLVARRDTNKDGKLELKESGLTADRFAAFDRDRDGFLSPAEFVSWRQLEPDIRYTIHLGSGLKGQKAIETPAPFASSRLRLDLRCDEGKMPGLAVAARKRFLDRFQDADANADGFVVAEEARQRTHYELRALLEAADHDGDHKLSKAEVERWMDLQDMLAEVNVLLTILDYGAGLFELLDADHDGSLSVPELRQTYARLSRAGCLRADGDFEASKLPRNLILITSRGHPVNPLSSAHRYGPEWFQAMDRNNDGYVSRREFIGPADVFDKLDRDRDGLLGPVEAAQADMKKRD